MQEERAKQLAPMIQHRSPMRNNTQLFSPSPVAFPSNPLQTHPLLAHSSHLARLPQTNLNSNISRLLLDNLDQVLVHISKLILALNLLGLLRAGARLGDHDNTGRSLGVAGGTELRAASHKNIRHVVVLAQHGDVADDVHGRDVGGQNHDTGRWGAARCAWCGFTERFDDFFDTAFEGFVFGSCLGEMVLVWSYFGRYFL